MTAPPAPASLSPSASVTSSTPDSGQRAAARRALINGDAGLAFDLLAEVVTVSLDDPVMAARLLAEALFTEAMRLAAGCPSGCESAGAQSCPQARRADQDRDVGASANDAAPAAVRAFGPLTVVRGGRETRVGLDSPGRALRYLVASGGSVHEEELIDMLWPDAAPDAGRVRLRTLLSRVRGRYGPVLARDKSVVRLADGISVDAHRFAKLSRKALVGHNRDSARLAREAIALYSSDLLPLARYAEWAVTARERLRQRYLDLLALLVDDAVERDDLVAAIGYARKIIDSDRLDESGYVRLARLQLDAGQSGAARETVAAAKRAAAELGLPASVELARVERRLG